MSQIKSITQVVNSIKSVLEKSFELNSISCSGEISNFTKHSSGHWYFSLKDDQSKINCVMFRNANLKVIHPISEGDEVIANGFITMYSGTGQVQLVLNSMQLAGQGILYKKYLELRDKLNKEGYFKAEHKKPLPKYPESIAVIAGHQSAALADILRTLKERWPIAKVTVYESLVQGLNAPSDLIKNLRVADQSDHDVIILARGGGSLEDLWAFNNEDLVKEIYECDTPIVTGVGHEIDVTLVDYVADKRALTPTGAAQLITVDKDDLLNYLQDVTNTLIHKQNNRLQVLQMKHHQIMTHSVFTKPQLLLLDYYMKVQEYQQYLKEYFDFKQKKVKELQSQFNTLFLKSKQQLQKQNFLIKGINESLITKISNKLNNQIYLIKDLSTKLELKSPLNIMKKGYVLTYQNNHLIKSSKDLKDEISLTLRYHDGTINTKILEKEGSHD